MIGNRKIVQKIGVRIETYRKDIGGEWLMQNPLHFRELHLTCITLEDHKSHSVASLFDLSFQKNNASEVSCIYYSWIINQCTVG